MPALRHLFQHIRQYGLRHRSLYAVSMMLFFFLIFDGMMTFIVPLAITSKGISESTMGLIIGSSSVAGIIFDFILWRLMKKSTYRRMFLIMFLVAVSFPLIILKAGTIFLFVVGMIIWGIYYDLYNVSTFDFVGRTAEKSEHASSFGVIEVFITLGYLIAPLVVGIFAAETYSNSVFIVAWVFLGIALIFYLLLRSIQKETGELSDGKINPLNKLFEFAIWRKVARMLLPVLLLTLMLNMIESTFWTISPLLTENFENMPKFSSFFLFLHELPPLFFGWFVGSLARRRSKKRMAFLSLLFGGLFLSMFLFVRQPALLLILCLFASFFTGMAWPAINGAYADYIRETPEKAKDVEMLVDSFTNAGFIFGPVMAGFLSAAFGHLHAFGYVGLISVFLAIILLIFTPKQINLNGVKIDGYDLYRPQTVKR